MVTEKMNFTLPKEDCDTYPARQSNAITKEYYNFLVGEINRGTIRKAVCRIEKQPFNVVSYHLVSVR